MSNFLTLLLILNVKSFVTTMLIIPYVLVFMPFSWMLVLQIFCGTILLRLIGATLGESMGIVE